MTFIMTELVVESEGGLRHLHQETEARYKNNVFENVGKVVHLNLDETWQNVLERIAIWAQANSPWAVQFNSGLGKGYEVEILATLTPRHDLEHFGMREQGQPRCLEVLICSGPVTQKMLERLLRVYAQMPRPKFVVAVGSLPVSGDILQAPDNIVGHIDEIIPVDIYIPGCPPTPEAIVNGMAELLSSLKK